jgi:hypothetical protein
MPAAFLIVWKTMRSSLLLAVSPRGRGYGLGAVFSLPFRGFPGSKTAVGTGARGGKFRRRMLPHGPSGAQRSRGVIPRFAGSFALFPASQMRLLHAAVNTAATASTDACGACGRRASSGA